MQIDSFLRSLEARNASANTVRAYRADLEDFGRCIGTVEVVTRRHIADYLVNLNGRGMKRASVRRKLAAVKSLFRWLHAEGLAEDVTASIDAPRVPHQIPHWPSEQEMTQLLTGPMLGPFPERDRLILEMLYGTGVRVDELVGMRLEDFSESDVVLVRGKGKKERLVIFGEPAQDALQAYLPIRKKVLAGKKCRSTALFFGLTAGGEEIEHLNVRSIVRIVKRAAQAKGVVPRHPHAFRHAFATHLLDHGASIVAVSRLLGHSKLSTTEKYTHISPERMMRSYNAAHPHAAR